MALALLLAGCVPEESIFPLFTKEDTLFDQQLLGEWRIWSGTTLKPGEQPGRIVFSTAESAYTYNVYVPTFDAEGRSLSSIARLIKLGNYVFIDFGTPDIYKLPQIPYPALACHVFGRLTLDKDKARIDFLSDEWVKNQGQAAQLELKLENPGNPILVTKTEDLRKFALEHAGDQAAFSETFTLVRKN